MALTTIPPAGAKLRGSTLLALITEVRPLRVIKASDETINSNATLQDDDHLQLAVEANAVYEMHHHWVFNSGTTPDFKGGYSVPAGATLKWWTQSSSSTSAASGLTEASTVIYDGTASDVSVHSVGQLTTTNAGTLKFRWAQNTSDAGSTIVRATSVLDLVRLS